MIQSICNSSRTVSLPIIRRSGGLPFVCYALNSALQQVNYPRLSEVIDTIVNHVDEDSEDDMHIVHDLNIVKVLISSPDFTHLLHHHYLMLLRRCLVYLDYSKYTIESFSDHIVGM